MQRRTFVTGAAGLAALPLAALMLPEAKGAQAPRLPATARSAAGLPSRAHVVGVMRRVNDHWIGTHGEPRTNDWAHATYHSGNMALYRLTGEKRYLSHTTRWAEAFDYRLLRDGSPRFADHQCAGETYLDLHDIYRDPAMITDIEASVRAMAGTGVTDWTWVDALHMAMPAWARLGRLRDDPSLHADLARRYTHTRDAEGGGLYDPATGLWWRDRRFIPPSRTRLGGTRMVVWSRGNGWALAALAKTFRALPSDAPLVATYRADFLRMSRGLAAVQRPDGFWNPNLDDPAHHGGPETSGTAFFTFGLAWGVRAGLLPRNEFLPVIARAWRALASTAARPNGFLGYVQPAGDRPAPAMLRSTTDFGVGGFLLAGTEVARLIR